MATPPVFSAGAVLTAAQMNAVGLWLVKSQTVGTAVSSIDVSNAFSADYDNYLVHYSGGVASTACDFRLRIGGVTSALYDANLIYQPWGNTTGYGAAETNLTYFPWMGTATTDATIMSVTIFNPYLTDYTYVKSDTFNIDAGSGYPFGRLKTTGSYTSFEVIPVSATLTGGTIRVYGYRK